MSSQGWLDPVPDLIHIIVRMIKCRRLGWTGHIAEMEVGNTALKILAGKPDLKRTIGRPRHRSVDNIRINLDVDTRNSIDSAQDRGY
jgi:hypothetical protein